MNKKASFNTKLKQAEQFAADQIAKNQVTQFRIDEAKFQRQELRLRKLLGGDLVSLPPRFPTLRERKEFWNCPGKKHDSWDTITLALSTCY
jgi:hypothetical protein